MCNILYQFLKNISSKSAVTLVNHERKAAAGFLRILLDENLRWYQHIDYIKLKISRSAYVMHTIRKHLFVSDMETSYCAIVWH